MLVLWILINQNDDFFLLIKTLYDGCNIYLCDCYLEGDWIFPGKIGITQFFKKHWCSSDAGGGTQTQALLFLISFFFSAVFCLGFGSLYIMNGRSVSNCWFFMFIGNVTDKVQSSFSTKQFFIVLVVSQTDFYTQVLDQKNVLQCGVLNWSVAQLGLCFNEVMRAFQQQNPGFCS